MSYKTSYYDYEFMTNKIVLSLFLFRIRSVYESCQDRTRRFQTRSSWTSLVLKFYSSICLIHDYESRGQLKTVLKTILKISLDYEYGPKNFCSDEFSDTWKKECNSSNIEWNNLDGAQTYDECPAENMRLKPI